MTSYPSHLIQHAVLSDGTPVTIRPIQPQDGELAQEFVRGLSDEARYFRFMDPLRELTPRMVSHFTSVDHDLHLALIAVSEAGGRDVEVGVARYVAAPDRERCEFSIVVADEWQKKGLGTLLMRELIAAARAAGIREMFGEVLATNAKMLRFVVRLGFRAAPAESDPRLVLVALPLRASEGKPGAV
jgi:acetyltransferase